MIGSFAETQCKDYKENSVIDDMLTKIELKQIMLSNDVEDERVLKNKVWVSS